MISPVSREIVSVPDLAVAVSDRSVTIADAIPGLAETVVPIISERTSLILDAGWICDPAGAISAVSKARHTTAAIEVSVRELARANRRTAADGMLAKRRPPSHR